MAKIQLGAAPKTFPCKVKFPIVSGGEGEIKVEFNYRTRSQFAEFIAGLYPDLKDGGLQAQAPGVDVVVGAAKGIASDVQHILGSVASWDLDDELNEQNARRLVDEFPGAASALMVAYREAITEGRAKN